MFTTEIKEDAKEKVRILICVQRGVGFLGEDVAKVTLYLLQERSGRTLKQLVDTPDKLVLALRPLLGPRSVLVYDSIRRELLLSSVGHPPRNGRLEEFLTALFKAKESMRAGPVP